nr:MAG TPA: hypothetical protein [Caudoviricetes sp.]
MKNILQPRNRLAPYHLLLKNFANFLHLFLQLQP